MKLYRLNGFRNLMLACLGVALLGLFGCATEKPIEKKEYGDIVWPSPPDTPRIRFLAEYSGQSDFGSKSSFKASLLGEESGGLQLDKPYAATASADGNLIYVTDTKLHAVVVFDFKEKEVRALQTDASGGLVTPMDVKLDKRGRIFVADATRQEVLVYSPEGKTLLTLGKKEELGRPTGLAIDDGRNRLYVADTIKHRIVVYNLEGKYLFSIGERGDDPSQLNYPTSLAVDTKGNLLVSDSGNFRAQVFNADGKPVRTIGQLGDSYGSFSRPKGIASDSDNNIYVVDGAFSNFQIFDSEGKLLLFVGTMGKEPGMFWLPTGIYINRGDRIYVVDSLNARIQIFQYLKEGRTPIEK
ncbi:MAG: 6-bladed beta-propeller [Gallionellaceae bacterium]|nr:6-bladed beta-propeller [Gallionellaceae bacterium]